MLKEIGKYTFVKVKWDFLLHRSGQRDREQCGFWVWADSLWWPGSLPDVWEGFPGTDPCPEARIHPQRCCHRLHPQWHVGTCLMPFPDLILLPLKAMCSTQHFLSLSIIWVEKIKEHKCKWGLLHGYVVVGSVNNEVWSLGLPQESHIQPGALRQHGGCGTAVFSNMPCSPIHCLSRLRDFLGLTGKGEMCKWKRHNAFHWPTQLMNKQIDLYNLILPFRYNRHLSSYF